MLFSSFIINVVFCVNFRDMIVNIKRMSHSIKWTPIDVEASHIIMGLGY